MCSLIATSAIPEDCFCASTHPAQEVRAQRPQIRPSQTEL